MSSLSVKQEHQQITYVCNSCQEKRIILFPANMKIKVDSRGLSEFVDIHKCKNDELKALILFVDAQYAVRSQVPISSEEATTSAADNFASIPVPMPRKTELGKIEIQPDDKFKASVINELKIKDRLRQLQYLLAPKKNIADRDIKIDSQFCFIQIEANVSKKADLAIAKRWFKEIANILEQTVNVQDKVFTLLLTYLEDKMKHDSFVREFKEVEILLHGPVTIPMTTQAAITDFEDRWVSLSAKLTLGDYSEYKKILLVCLDNKNQTLLDIYDLLSSQMNPSYFLAAIFELFRNSFIKLEKPQFFATSDL